MDTRRGRGGANRKHMARYERERRQTNLILIGSISVVAIVLVLVAYGLVLSQIIEPRQPVAIVNGDEVTTREFQARVRYERNALINQYINTQNNMLLFGSDPQFQTFFQNQLQQIEFQLEPSTIGRLVLNNLIADQLIRQEAETRGLSIPETEIEKTLEEFFGFYGGEPPPTPTELPTSEPTSTLTALQETLTAPSTTITTSVEITATQIATATLTVDPSETDPEAVTATPVVTITATPFPTATPYTLDAFESDYEDTIRFLDSAYGFTENDLRSLIESQLLRQMLLEEMTSELSQEQDQVWARHILVPDEETALEAIARLESGEDFAVLAAELSTDTSNANSGGDLGWFGTGRMIPDFEKVAFNLEIGEVSVPTQTQFGWHVIQVLGHESRPLGATEYQQLQATTFEEWLSGARLSADEETLDYWADRTPTDPVLPAAGSIPQPQPNP